MKFIIRCTRAEMVEAATQEIARKHGILPGFVELEVVRSKRVRPTPMGIDLSPIVDRLPGLDVPFRGSATEIGRALGLTLCAPRVGRLIAACSRGGVPGYQIRSEGHTRHGSRWVISKA